MMEMGGVCGRHSDVDEALLESCGAMRADSNLRF